MQRLAHKQIEDAMAEGQFDHSPGKSQPVVIDEGPFNEDARALWWSLRVLRQNAVLPDEIRIRRTIDYLKSRFTTACDETRVETLVKQIDGIAAPGPGAVIWRSNAALAQRRAGGQAGS